MSKKFNSLVENKEISKHKRTEDHFCEANTVSNDLLTSSPRKSWNDEKIRLSVERFYSENGRLPLTREFISCPYLPYPLVITKHYNMPIVTWLTLTFPDYNLTSTAVAISNYKLMDVSDFRDVFFEEFKRIRPTSSYMFNEKRKPTTPTWQYIARRCGIKTWTSLKEFTGVNSLPPIDNSTKFTVIRHIKNFTD